KGRLSCTDLAKRLDHVLHARDSRGIGARADEHEVVVHDLETLHAVALGDELLLERPGVHEHHVRVAAASDVERLPGADGDDPHLDARLAGENRQQVAKKARLLRGGGRRDRDELLLCMRGADGAAEDQCSEEETQGSSPLMNAAASGEAGLRKNRSTGACSASRPSCRNNTSSPSRRAWPRLCVAMTIFVPAA